MFWRKAGASASSPQDNVPVSAATPMPVAVHAPAEASTTAATFGGTTKTVAATGTPEPLVGVTTLVDTVIISPLRTNTGIAYAGFAAGNDTQQNETPIVIAAPNGKKIDLSLIYIDVTVAGEGVRYSTID